MRKMWLISLFLLLSCAEEKEAGKLQLNTVIDKVKVLHPLPDVDVLFVFDYENLSPSVRQNFVDHGNVFLEPLRANPLVDVRVGFVNSSRGEECSGGLIQGDYFQSARGENTQEIAGQLSQGVFALDSSCASYRHRPLNVAMEILSSGDGGFHRQGASLAVIFVTDIHGEGDVSAEEFSNFLLTGGFLKIALYGAIVEQDAPSHCVSSGGENSRPIELEKAIDRFGGETFNLCTIFMRESLGAMGQNLALRFGEVFVPLDKFPAAGTITVRYGDQLLENSYPGGWSYDPNRKGIRVGGALDIPKDAVGANRLEVLFYPGDEHKTAQAVEALKKSKKRTDRN